MKKASYLKYFRNTDSTRKLTEQSLDHSWMVNDQNHEGTQKLQEMCSDRVGETNEMRSQIKNNLFKELEVEKTRKNGFLNKGGKVGHIKNIRALNKTTEDVKRRNQTEGGNDFKNDFHLNSKNFSDQPQFSSTFSQGLNAHKMITQSLHNQDTRNYSEMGIQRLKNLQSSSLYNPCFGQQKFFVQPIKPYDRNKTARNKKFRTLKTAFGDLNSSCRNYNDEYTMSLENLRMGWRIVNTKSMIEEYLNSTYFTYHLYNGSVINKQKSKDSASKEKKKINLKQMKNIYKVFFNQSITFNSNQNKNPQIFQSIKKKDQVNDYVMNQSQINSINNNHSEMIPNQQNTDQSSKNVEKNQNERNPKARKSHKIRPCFFRKTYKLKSNEFNTKICEKAKYQKVSQSLHSKQGTFFGKNRAETKQNQTKPQEDHLQMNQVFGKGATIIQVRNLKIQGGSTIKKDDLLVLELMDKNRLISEKGILTPPMKYSEIGCGIKFAIDIKAADFVPLKIWKYHGINLVELGIVDLNLLVFRNRKKYFEIENKLQSQNISDGIKEIHLYRQERQSVTTNRKQKRDILYYHTREKLRKNKKAEIQVTVSFNCLIYQKRFNKQKADLTDFSHKENMVLGYSFDEK